MLGVTLDPKDEHKNEKNQDSNKIKKLNNSPNVKGHLG